VPAERQTYGGDQFVRLQRGLAIADEEPVDRIPPGSLVLPGLRLWPRGIQRGGLVRDARKFISRDR